VFDQEDRMSLTRKEFLSTVMNAAAGAAGAALLVACGGGSSGDDDTGGNCLMSGTSVNIGGNHGHSMVVSAADVMDGAAKTYTLAGSDHTHNVTVSVGAFAMLSNNESAMTISTSGGGHTHNIMITCR
jgi:hypothetical protein